MSVRVALLATAFAIAACDRAPAHVEAQAAHVDAKAQAAHDRYRQPQKLVDALTLAPGDRVADVGAGQGYLTFRLAAAVGASGRVTATDVDARALAALTVAEAPAELKARVTTRRTQPDDPGLEAHAYNLVLLSEVDHLLPDRVAYLQKLVGTLAPGGRIAVSNKRTYQAALVDAATRAGLRTHEVDFTPTHFLIFLEAKQP